MALARYYEDIIERSHEETAERYETRLAKLFRNFTIRPISSGPVYLTRSDRRLEDIEVFEVNQEVVLQIVSTPGAATAEVTVEEGSTRQTHRKFSNNLCRLKFDHPGKHRLRVESGGYLKNYDLVVVQPFRVEQQLDFINLIRSLTERPPKWTNESFGQFRNQIESILRSNGVPELFIAGVVEYFLGLFHEEKRTVDFRERFQQAFGNLRWFIPYSDLARVICTQYLFCANEFPAAEKCCGESVSRLRSAILFYLDHGNAEPNKVKPKISSKPQAVSLLISLPDLLTFQAITAVEAGGSEEALELCATIRKDIQPKFDRERLERVTFVEARAYEQGGDDNKAHGLFETLATSPWSTIAQAAKERLNQLNHG